MSSLPQGAKAPVIATKPDGTHDVTYVPPPVGEPYEVGLFVLE